MSRETIHRLTDFKGNSFEYSLSVRRGVLHSCGIGLWVVYWALAVALFM